jgi:hypothetical protein
MSEPQLQLLSLAVSHAYTPSEPAVYTRAQQLLSLQWSEFAVESSDSVLRLQATHLGRFHELLLQQALVDVAKHLHRKPVSW